MLWSMGKFGGPPTAQETVAWLDRRRGRAEVADHTEGSMPIRSFTAARMRCLDPGERSVHDFYWN